VKVGTVSIDAVPWATVTAIVSEDGTPQPIPAEASTPMSLDLPVGSYRITLAGPPPESASKEVSVTVEDGKAGRVSDVRFTSLTAEDYFKPYLAPSPEEAPSDTQGAASPLVPAGLPSEVPR
jgi:hypothetical protein